MRLAGTLLALLAISGIAGCSTAAPVPSSSADSSKMSTPMPSGGAADEITMVTCGGASFPVEVLAGRGPAPADDYPGSLLRRHIKIQVHDELPPAERWIEAVRTDDQAVYILDAVTSEDPRTGEEPSHRYFSVHKVDGKWRSGWGGCIPRPAVEEGVVASFRIAPGEQLADDSTKINVLVHELSCTGGQDATGRILAPEFFTDSKSVTVVIAIRPPWRAGGCVHMPRHSPDLVRARAARASGSTPAARRIVVPAARTSPLA